MALDTTRTVDGVRLYSTLVGGYVENRSGWCRHCYGRDRRQVLEPNIRFLPENYEQIIERHEDWVMNPDTYAARKRVVAQPAASAPAVIAAAGTLGTPRTMAELWDQYEEEHSPYSDKVDPKDAMKRGTWKGINSAVGFVLRRPVRLVAGDAKANMHALLALIREAKADTSINKHTRSKYLQVFSRWCRNYVIPLGWLDADPIPIVGKVKRPTGLGGAIWQADEFAAITARLLRDYHPIYGLLVRTMGRSAIRPGEMVHVGRRDVTRDSEVVPVIVKGWLENLADLEKEYAPNWAAYWKERARMIAHRELPYRNIPLLLIPGLADDIEELRTLEYPPEMARSMPRHTQFLLPWTGYTKVRDAFNDVCKEEGIDRRGRVMYDLRATAIHWWETELKWPKEMCREVAGHSEGTYRQSYRFPPSASELRGMLDGQ